MKNFIILLASALLICCQPTIQQTQLDLLRVSLEKTKNENIWLLGYSKGLECGRSGDYCDMRNQFKKDTIRYRDTFH